MFERDGFGRSDRPLPVSADDGDSVLSCASGEEKSGVTDLDSTPGLFGLELVDRFFFPLLAEDVEALLPLLATTPASSPSTGGVGLRDEPAEILLRRALLPLLTRLCSLRMDELRWCSAFSGTW